LDEVVGVGDEVGDLCYVVLEECVVNVLYGELVVGGVVDDCGV